VLVCIPSVLQASPSTELRLTNGTSHRTLWRGESAGVHTGTPLPGALHEARRLLFFPLFTPVLARFRAQRDIVPAASKKCPFYTSHTRALLPWDGFRCNSPLFFGACFSSARIMSCDCSRGFTPAKGWLEGMPLGLMHSLTSSSGFILYRINYPTILKVRMARVLFTPRGVA
jgi:hypothetical protein